LQSIAYIGIPLDRMRMDATRRLDTQACRELHFASGSEVKKSAFVDHGLNHGRVWQWLQRVVQIDARQCFPQPMPLRADTLAIDDQQRRAELPHEAANFCGLERVYCW
jgi:hypothetical protein